MSALLKDRLDKCAEHGALSTADLALWFDLPYPTIRSYREGIAAQPYTNRRVQIEARLQALEKAVKGDVRLPVPLTVRAKDRKTYILTIRAFHSRK